MFGVIKKQTMFLVVCFLLSFIVCLLCSVNKELYSGIKSFFFCETVLSPNDIITVNYKRAGNNDSEFVVSGSSPVLIISLNDKYIENIRINFKEQLKDNLKLRIYIGKEKVVSDNTDNGLIKIEDMETSKDNLSYSAKINRFCKSFILIIGEKVGDSFIIDNISYDENYRYYWDKVFHYDYLRQLRVKNYWLNVLMLFGLFVGIIEYFIIRKSIYKKCMK